MKTTCKDHNDQDAPLLYIAWHEWADQKGKNHRQIKCGECGLYKIWVPIKRRKKR